MTDHLIVGLGNPGRHYRNNRHNAGFMLIDRMLEEHELLLDRSQSEALFAVRQEAGGRLILAKPQTYVNESGRAVGSLVKTLGIELGHLLVAFDDLDLPRGTLRMRPLGGSSGHRGVQSIINHLGESGFPRLRIGVGRPPGGTDAARYVLTDFSELESSEMAQVFERASSCIRKFVEAGIQLAMNDCNADNGSLVAD